MSPSAWRLAQRLLPSCTKSLPISKSVLSNAARDYRPVVRLPGYVRCPACRGELDTSLACRSCGRRYSAEDGIPRLLDPTAPGLDAKLREVEAWPVLAREQGWYERDDRVDAALPFLNSRRGWEDRAWGATEHG